MAANHPRSCSSLTDHINSAGVGNWGVEWENPDAGGTGGVGRDRDTEQVPWDGGSCWKGIWLGFNGLKNREK